MSEDPDIIIGKTTGLLVDNTVESFTSGACTFEVKPTQLWMNGVQFGGLLWRVLGASPTTMAADFDVPRPACLATMGSLSTLTGLRTEVGASWGVHQGTRVAPGGYPTLRFLKAGTGAEPVLGQWYFAMNLSNAITQTPNLDLRDSYGFDSSSSQVTIPNFTGPTKVHPVTFTYPSLAVPPPPSFP